MLLQVSNQGSMSIGSLSFLLWLIVIISVTVAVVVYFYRHYQKTFLWAHQVIDPLQNGWNRWNRQLNNWWQHNRGIYLFQRINTKNITTTYQQKEKAGDDGFAEELIDNLFSKESKTNDSSLQELKEENELLRQQNLQLKQELHAAKAHNRQLLHEINELQNYRRLNQQLQQRLNVLQAEVNDLTARWMKTSEGMKRLNDEVNSLSGVEKEWIDAVNHSKDLERQVQKIAILEEEIKSLEAEREWLLLQLQQVKTKQLHEYENLQQTCNSLVEERNLLQDKIVLLESEVGALSRALNNNKLKQSEDILWESKYITAARELHQMRLLYQNMENELSSLRNKEQLLREKAKLTDGLQTQLQVKNEELISLQRQLYDCRKK